MLRSIPPVTSTGSPRPKRGGEKRRKISTVKIGIGGGRKSIPKKGERVEPIPSWTFVSKPKFTRYCPKDKYALVERVTEPAVRILEDITEVVVVASLPGVNEKDIHIDVHGDILEISAQAKDEFGSKKYTKEMLLPFVVDSRTMAFSFENNILEIKLQKKQKKRRGKI